MIFRHEGKKIEFTKEVMETFNRYCQFGPDQHEAGGILLGRVFPDKILIEQVSEPACEDESGRYFFVRNVERAQKIINSAWESSNGELIYLGEWHTHPEPMPSPSSTDRTLIRNMLRDSKMRIDFLFMVIIGQKGIYVGRQHKKLIQLKSEDTKKEFNYL
ncbi:Mov34/MPN/PAD-1 family protein [Bacillus cereus]|uniref:Mov34/MPN/PAD-1 family protein n=1 Tax=Bacillus cereus TaxID=1396 RepID=UPI001D0E1A04|nr:Mov34/MPN/PAD-1 family protein [Bacillus cereus]MCC2382016.1 Mov34/MPN/PAD-1 family protein [Bacillus cereus]